MPKKKGQISLRDLEQEAKKLAAPATEKEKAIITAAAQLIGERGIDGATTAEIARRANVTEKTLFRYFPSKKDLVKRVLFPMLLRGGLTRQWGTIETLLKAKGSNFKSWCVEATTKELSIIAKNVGLTRTVDIELIQNEEFREALAPLWEQHIWRPMLETLTEMQTSGVLRKDIDVEVLARAIHCLHAGYFLARYVFAADRKWDDAREIDQMAEILARGSEARRA
jgi:AcrR family transcriptional regulator